MGSDVCLVAGVFIWEPFVRFLANPSWHARHILIHNFWSYLPSTTELMESLEILQDRFCDLVHDC